MDGGRDLDLYDRPRSFSGSGDFHRFCRRLEGSADFVQVPVGKPYAGIGPIERWYKSTETRRMWRLIEPDAPFAGTGEPVPESILRSRAG